MKKTISRETLLNRYIDAHDASNTLFVTASAQSAIEYLNGSSPTAATIGVFGLISALIARRISQKALHSVEEYLPRSTPHPHSILDYLYGVNYGALVQSVGNVCISFYEGSYVRGAIAGSVCAVSTAITVTSSSVKAKASKDILSLQEA